ncbi:low affinity iron permease family protein [Ralstonia pickettii]|uniref:low affinity iron permease family protein n=1 Tax=Ralstonia pickettii TaxID=329 RepID=UPI00271503E3|nr:low affinity iron permease family protein [Ralstonia pickettii]WKZ87311.1 low affinity iron permease family protein [Ralstonia pickettii]
MNKQPSEERSGKLQTVPDTDTTAYARPGRITRLFDAFAAFVTRWAGSPYAFGAAVLAIVVWTVTGPLFDYSDRWQLVINTGTTIITFLMVFVIQQSQNKDSIALHLKLNELLASHRTADNRLIGIEEATEDDLRRLAAAYLRIAHMAEAERGGALGADTSVSDSHAEK